MFTVINLITIIWWTFGPKINLISIDGFEQGVRTEDFLFLVSCFNNLANLPQWRIEKTIVGGSASVVLLTFMLASTLIAVGDRGESMMIFLFSLRWFEYFLMGAVIINFCLRFPDQIVKISKLILVFNALFSVESILSFERYSGLSAGPWEISSVLIFTYLGIKPFIHKLYQRNFYAILVLTVILAAQARIQLISFIFLLILMRETRFKTLVIALSIAVLLATKSLVLSQIQLLRSGMLEFDAFKEVLTTIMQVGGELDYYAIARANPDFDSSTIARLMIWFSFVQKWIDNLPVSMIVGLGPGCVGVVVDGLYIRIVTEFGLVGIICFLRFIWGLLSNLKTDFRAQILLSFCVISLTNDPITSQRIFSSICLSIGLLLAHQTSTPHRETLKTTNF